MRRHIAYMTAVALSFASAMPASAAYPDHTIRFICGFPPGGTTDFIARLVASKLSERWGQPIVVENKPGVEGSIGSSEVAHATPDGYTINVTSDSHTTTPSMYKLNYDPIKSFEPIILLGGNRDILVVHPSFPIKTVGELIAYAKSQPKIVNFASSGSGTASFLEMARFMSLTGTNMTHVPYKGGIPALTATIGGEVQVGFDPLTTARSAVQAGSLRALAIAGLARSKLLPDVPTFAEAGLPEFGEGGAWYGILAPAGTPKEIVLKMNKEVISIMRSQEVQEKLTQIGFETIADTPEEFAVRIDADIKKWAEVIKGLGVNP